MDSSHTSDNSLPWILDDLVPHIVDRRAKGSPHAVFAEYPASSTTYSEGYDQVTYLQLANAINGFAHWLHDTFGSQINNKRLAYIGPNDLRYPALILGAAKLGCVVSSQSLMDVS